MHCIPIPFLFNLISLVLSLLVVFSPVVVLPLVRALVLLNQLPSLDPAEERESLPGAVSGRSCRTISFIDANAYWHAILQKNGLMEPGHQSKFMGCRI